MQHYMPFVRAFITVAVFCRSYSDLYNELLSMVYNRTLAKSRLYKNK